jgi:hypothetical protein
VAEIVAATKRASNNRSRSQVDTSLDRRRSYEHHTQRRRPYRLPADRDTRLDKNADFATRLQASDSAPQTKSSGITSTVLKRRGTPGDAGIEQYQHRLLHSRVVRHQITTQGAAQPSSGHTRRGALYRKMKLRAVDFRPNGRVAHRWLKRCRRAGRCQTSIVERRALHPAERTTTRNPMHEHLSVMTRQSWRRNARLIEARQSC